ncbi:MAG: hypothetical protein HKP61_13275 [Dactylosporangium sp.]|nr:hypothetical protein [Dactylosporangium sp.]NNJ61887.1 hypothetical protein [Dactylosporangium sp.]
MPELGTCCGQEAFSSLALGSVMLRNRIGFGPVNPGFGSLLDPRRAGDICEFYRQYAMARVGLIYLGGVAVSPEGRANVHSLTMHDPIHRRVIEQIAETVAAGGSTLAVQLMHAGRQTSSSEIGCPILAASAEACHVIGEVPAEATRADIRRIVTRFGEAARLAVKAGAAAIEIHAAHGYLVSGFLSQRLNRRSDCYGGSVHGRFRILREIVSEVRNAGAECVGIRVNVSESGRPGGTELPELLEGLLPLVASLDYTSVTAGIYTRSQDWIIPARKLGRALWRHQAAALRHGLGLPIMVAGNIDSVELANQVVQEESADLVLMVRALLADPNLITKWVDGRSDCVQPCTELFYCKYHSRGAPHVYCPHNPVLRKRFGADYHGAPRQATADSGAYRRMPYAARKSRTCEEP